MSKNCVAIVCDDGFLEPALFVSSLALNQEARNYDLVICSAQDLQTFAPQLDVAFRKIDVQSFVSELPVNERLKEYTYWRLPAIESLAQDYDRILYLDADTFIDTRTLSDIFDIDMKGAVLAAALDVHQRTRPNRIPNEFKALKLPNAPYFNAGVLLIDGGKWKSGGWFKKISEMSKQCSNVLFAHDQSLLNLAFRENWVEFAPAWNWQYSPKISFLTEFASPRIIHFSGPKKHWHAPDGSIPLKYHSAYASFRKAHGRFVPDDNHAPFSSENIAKIRKLFLKNVWYLRRHLKFLRRITSDMKTIDHRQDSQAQSRDRGILGVTSGHIE